MNNNSFKFKNVSFVLPEGWFNHVEGMDTPTNEYAINTETGSAKLFIAEIDSSRAMPFGKDSEMISTIHSQSIDDESGLIEMATVINGDVSTVHTIFKRKVNDSANPMLKIFYSASQFVHLPNGNVYIFQFRGIEEGRTGLRDNQVLADLRTKGVVTIEPDPQSGKQVIQGWQQDPYDPSFNKGFLMNQSEKPEYDSFFPQHPLPLLRSALFEVSQTVKEV